MKAGRWEGEGRIDTVPYPPPTPQKNYPQKAQPYTPDPQKVAAIMKM